MKNLPRALLKLVLTPAPRFATFAWSAGCVVAIFKNNPAMFLLCGLAASFAAMVWIETKRAAKP